MSNRRRLRRIYRSGLGSVFGRSGTRRNMRRFRKAWSKFNKRGNL